MAFKEFSLKGFPGIVRGDDRQRPRKMAICVA
jgi:hypothetical protein